MSIITPSSLSGFSIPEYRSVIRIARSSDQTAVKVSAAIILAMVDLVLVMWVFPVATQLAEWRGVSFLNAIYVGGAAAVLSIPIVVVGSILVLRRFVRR